MISNEKSSNIAVRGIRKLGLKIFQESDPNAWGNEHGNPRYILDLILSCITVSLKTLDIVENLPEIDFGA